MNTLAQTRLPRRVPTPLSHVPKRSLHRKPGAAARRIAERTRLIPLTAAEISSTFISLPS